jgi:hypothetical protein
LNPHWNLLQDALDAEMEERHKLGCLLAPALTHNAVRCMTQLVPHLQDALDAEMEERRKRVDEWRKKRAAEAAAAELERKQQEEAAAAAAAADEAAAGKGWSLEDDEDDEAHEQLGEVRFRVWHVCGGGHLGSLGYSCMV